MSPRMPRIQQGWQRWTVAVHVTLGQIAPSQVLPRGGWRRRLWGFGGSWGVWGSTRGFGHSQVGGTSIRYTRREPAMSTRPMSPAHSPMPGCEGFGTTNDGPPPRSHPCPACEHRPHEPPHQIQNAERRWDGWRGMEPMGLSGDRALRNEGVCGVNGAGERVSCPLQKGRTRRHF
jgi:hypothetical protein